MSRNNHLVQQEELMAYLDGELASDRAVEAAAHLERCAECQELAAELKKISQEMMSWEIESLETAGIPTDIAVALEKPRKSAKKTSNRTMWGIVLTPQRLAFGGGVTAVLLFVIVGLIVPSHRMSVTQLKDDHITTQTYGPEYGKSSGSLGGLVASATPAPSYNNYNALASTDTTNGPLTGYTSSDLAFSFSPAATSEKQRSVSGENAKASSQASDEENSSDRTAGVPAVPMIARTAGLTLVAKEFDKTRASLEEILKRHNGYVGELSVSAPSDAGRTLTATLRVPAPQLDAALSELKKLGRVENESQGGEEVTAEYVDLEARLKNAQHTEQRLTEILRSRTGKLQDVLKVELEIDRVRGEIEQMQAEKKELTKRVAFSTVNATVKEEYHAQLQTAPPSTGSRFHNAAVDGYNSVVEGLISVGLFLLSSGPSLLIWAAILFFPVRWIWRKVRAELKKNHVGEVS